MAKLSDEKILEIQKVYKEVGTYSGTAKIVGCSPATVKKYCFGDGCTVAGAAAVVKEKVPFTKEIPPVEDVPWDWNNVQGLLSMLREEIEECERFNDERRK